MKSTIIIFTALIVAASAAFVALAEAGVNPWMIAALGIAVLFKMAASLVLAARQHQCPQKAEEAQKSGSLKLAASKNKEG